MTQLSARIPDELAIALDAAARQNDLSTDEIVQQALEHHLEDLEDISIALERLDDPSDLTLDWNQVKSELLDSDKE